MGGREGGREGGRQGGREGTRAKPGNKLVCILWVYAMSMQVDLCGNVCMHIMDCMNHYLYA